MLNIVRSLILWALRHPEKQTQEDLSYWARPAIRARTNSASIHYTSMTGKELR